MPAKKTSVMDNELTKNSVKVNPAKKKTLNAPKKVITRIVICYDVGFNNTLTLRGKGADLNWEKGIPLKNVKHDEWLWETDLSFDSCEFKVLINDSQFESGENHPISCGASVQYTPVF